MPQTVPQQLWLMLDMATSTVERQLDNSELACTEHWVKAAHFDLSTICMNFSSLSSSQNFPAHPHSTGYTANTQALHVLEDPARLQSLWVKQTSEDSRRASRKDAYSSDAEGSFL